MTTEQTLKEDVNPKEAPVKFNRSAAGVEAWAIFCVMVAGKGADQTKRQVEKLLAPAIALKLRPFDYLRQIIQRDGNLENILRDARTGQYTKLNRAFMTLAADWSAERLLTCSVDDLEKVHGIGMKTSRFFMLSTRPDAKVAALDTHLLKKLRTPEAARFLQEEGLTTERVPKATPSRALYVKLERCVLRMAAEANMTPAEYDYSVWLSYYKGH